MPHLALSKAFLEAIINNSYKKISKYALYRLPINKKSIDSNTSAKSTNFDFKFFSLNTIAPNKKLTRTDPRRTIETILIIAPSSPRA